MTDSEVLDLFRSAIQNARIAYPTFPDSAKRWDQSTLSSEEAHLFAHAANEALRKAGLKVVKKEDGK